MKEKLCLDVDPSIIRRKIDAVPVSDRTREVERSDYDRAIDNYMALLEGSGYCSVYQIGSIGMPGLSDIDLLVAFDGPCRKGLEELSISKLSSEDQYVFSHNPFFVHESVLENLGVWFPIFDLVRVAGKEQEIARTSGLGVPGKLLLVVNFLLTKVPRDLLAYSFVLGSLCERTTIAVVNSLRHTLNLWEQTCGAALPGAESFVARFDAFRSGWFGFDEGERLDVLKDFVIEASRLSFELYADVAHFLRGNYVSEVSESAIRVDFERPSARRGFVFEGNWSGAEAFEGLVRSGCEDTSCPVELGLLFQVLAGSDGPVGKHLRSIDGPSRLPRPVDSGLIAASENYRRWIDRYARFFQQNFRITGDFYSTFWCPPSNSRASSWYFKGRNYLRRRLGSRGGAGMKRAGAETK